MLTVPLFLLKCPDPSAEIVLRTRAVIVKETEAALSECQASRWTAADRPGVVPALRDPHSQVGRDH